MKRQFLVWLYNHLHKFKWLRKKIEMLYWIDLLGIQEKKERRQTKYEKKLKELEEKLIKDINSVRKGFLYGKDDGGTVMTKLTTEEANKEMIKRLEQWGVKPEAIPERLRFLGFKVEDKPLEEPKETTMILKEVSRIEEKKPKRRTTNGKRKTTAKAHA